MTNAMTMAHTGAQMLVVNKADPKLVTPDGVYAFAVTGCELRRNPNGSCDCPIGRAHAAIANSKGHS
jgi:hypothetical protein